MIAIIIRIVKQMLNDKRSLAMILLAPLLIMTFMFMILGDSHYVPQVALSNVPAEISELMQESGLDLVEPETSLEDALLDGSIDAIISMDQRTINIKLLEPNSVVLRQINKSLTEVNAQLPQGQPHSTISFIYGSSEATTFDGMIHVLLGVYSFFLVFLISGIAFVRERTVGTMERFMLAPISRHAVVSGFIIGYGIFALLQSVLLIAFTTLVLGVTITGSLFAIVCIMTLLSFLAIATGSFVSVLAKNEFQVIQFIPIILTPQIFFSGIISIRTLPYNMDVIAQFMPIKHAASALNKIILQYGTLSTVKTEITILALMLVALYSINVIMLKKYRVV